MRMISRGSLGEVYSAVDSSGRSLAIKRLRPILIYDREEREKLSREAKILRHLSGHYFPQWIGGDTECEEPYLVMEWLEGQPISTLFPSAQKQNFDQAFLKFADSFVDALKILQNIPSPEPGPVGLIHADINPKNILVGTDGGVRIFDFSHARWVREGEQSLGGTRGYMGLDQMAHGKLHLGTDLFAMGLILAEILQGSPIISGKNLFSIFLQLKELDPHQVAQQVTHKQSYQEILHYLLDLSPLGVRERLNEVENRIKDLVEK